VGDRNMLELNNVCYRIGEKVIFNNINVKIAPGELVCLLGANGAGKSTLLKSICEDIKFEGEIKINGQLLTNYDLKSLAKIRAVMPQKVHLNFSFTCIEVVSMGRSVHNPILDEEDKSIIEICMRLCGVWEFKNKRYPLLSGGEQQRVQLARVLSQIYTTDNNQHPTARILLLDECTSSLDPKFQHQVYRILQKLKMHNIAILSVIHDINLASQYADRILCPIKAVNSDSVFQTYDLHTHVIKHHLTDRPVVIALDQA